MLVTEEDVHTGGVNWGFALRKERQQGHEHWEWICRLMQQCMGGTRVWEEEKF